MGRRSAAVLAAVCLVAAGCSGNGPDGGAPADLDAGYPPLDPPEAAPDLLRAAELGDGFVIEEYRPGRCRFDYRAQIARVSVDGDTRWVVDVPWPTRPPEIAGGVVVGRFAADGRDGVFAVDVDGGTPLWQRWFDRVATVVSGPGVVAVRTVTSDDERPVEFLDPRTGDRTGSIDLGPGWTAVEVDGVVVADTADGLVGMVDGETTWSVALDEPPETQLLAAGGVVLAGQYPATSTAHDPADGRELWRWRLDEPGSYAFLMGVANGVAVFEVGFDHDSGLEPPEDGSDRGVVAIDMETGAELWSRRSVEPLLVGATLVLRDRYFAEPVVVDLRDGTVRWDVPDVVEPRAEGGGYVALSSYGDDSTRLVRSADGSGFWESPSGAVSAIVRVDETLLVGTQLALDSSVVDADPGGVLYAIDPETGEQRWTLELRDPFTFPPLLAPDGDLIVTASDPSIFCD